MNTVNEKYNLFLRFIDNYLPAGFKSISADDSLVLDLEDMMERQNQFFYVADLIEIQFIYTSKRSKIMMGVDPAELNPYHFYEATHPDDRRRLNLGRAQLFKIADDLMSAEKGTTLLSTNFRVRNPEGDYSDILNQVFLFYSAIPRKTVYILKLHTNIDWFKKIHHGYHYYIGSDLSNFRYPDESLLMTGNTLSDREFQIVKLIGAGQSSEHIANQLSLSLHTVNTHRKNILRKTGKANITELIYELMVNGVL